MSRKRQKKTLFLMGGDSPTNKISNLLTSKLNHINLLHSDKSTYFYKGRLNKISACVQLFCHKGLYPGWRGSKSRSVGPDSESATKAHWQNSGCIQNLLLALPACALLGLVNLLINPNIASSINANNAYAIGESSQSEKGTDDEQPDDGTSSLSLTLADSANNGVMSVDSDNNINIEKQMTSSSVGYISVDFTVKANNVSRYDVYVQSSKADLIGSDSGDKISSISGTSNLQSQNKTWGYNVVEGANVDPSSITYQPVQTSAVTAIQSKEPTSGNTTLTTNQAYTLAFAANLNGASPDHYKTDITLSVASGAKEVATLYSVTYNTNGSTAGATPASQTANSNSNTYTFTTPLQGDLARDGYFFLGWSQNPNTASPQYVAGNNITLTSDSPNIILYAVWVGQDTPASKWSELYFMQQMNTTACADGNETGKQLIDARDNKKYWVAKLKDGNCWMTQNLALDLKGKVLTPSDSDVTNNWSEASNIDSALWNDTSTNTIKWYHSDQGSGHGSYGNYYSFQAATAGTGSSATTKGEDATSSICPKGWRLPLSDTSAANESFDKLLSGLSATTVKDAPYYYIYGGYISNNTLTSFNSEGRYWSSTAYDANSAYSLLVNSSNTRPSDFNVRYRGLSVRCVAR